MLASFHIYTSSCVDMIGLDYTTGSKILAASDVLLKFLRNREGRENRPQLRCGIASQTPTGPSVRRLRVKSIGTLIPVKARGEALSRRAGRKARAATRRHMRSPNI